MKDGNLGTATIAGDERAAAGEEVTPLGWDGVGAIVILLLAALSLRDRMPDAIAARLLLRVLWWVVYAAAVVRLFQQFRTDWLPSTVRQQPTLCVLLTLTLASCVWSLDPPLTLQKAVSLLGTTIVAVFIGSIGPPRRLMRVLYWTFTLLILSSIASSLLLRDQVAEGMGLGWRGLMGHKNSLGAAAVLATSFFLVLMLKRQVQPIWGTALCAASVLALALSRSRTSMAALIPSLIALAYVVARQPTAARLRHMALGLVLVVALVPFLVAPLATVLGSDDPLNGRLQLWDQALAILKERPLIGYGYAAVWGRKNDTLLPHIATTANRSASNAHNGVMNVATELGIPAALVACAYLFVALVNAGRLLEREPSAFSFFALVFLIAFVVMSFAEAHLFQIHWFFWILFVALTVAVRRALNGTTLNGATVVAGIGTER